jgi:hypothetical protein
MRAFLQRGILVLLVLAGCAPLGPPLGAAQLPPVPSGLARVFFYRPLEPYEAKDMANVLMNGQGVGASANGGVFYRDVQPGQYTITVAYSETYPNQFKTVVLRPGESAYVRIDSLSSWTACTVLTNCYPTFVVRIVDPTVARGEMRSLNLIAG